MPHYLGGKLGRSSSRSIFLSVHFTPLGRYPATPPSSIRFGPSRFDFRERKKERVSHALSLSHHPSLSLPRPVLPLGLACSRSLLGLSIIYLWIGSLSARDPPLSPLSFDRSPVPLCHPLPRRLSSWTHHGPPSPPRIFVSSEQRERVTIYSGDPRDRSLSALVLAFG